MAAPDGNDFDGLHGDRGERTEGDQGVHAHCAMTQQASGVAEERPAAGELDDDGQDDDVELGHAVGTSAKSKGWEKCIG